MTSTVSTFAMIAAAGSISHRCASSRIATVILQVLWSAFAGPTCRLENSLLAASVVEMRTLTFASTASTCWSYVFMMPTTSV